MAFHLTEEREADDYYTSWERYEAYLEAHRELLPQSAYAIAKSAWWYAFDDARGPHDAHLERIEMGDVLDYDSEDGVYCWIRIHLLSAYTGRITLHYPRVFGYQVVMPVDRPAVHGDWRYDEITSDGNDGRFNH